MELILKHYEPTKGEISAFLWVLRDASKTISDLLWEPIAKIFTIKDLIRMRDIYLEIGWEYKEYIERINNIIKEKSPS